MKRSPYLDKMFETRPQGCNTIAVPKKKFQELVDEIKPKILTKAIKSHYNAEDGKWIEQVKDYRYFKYKGVIVGEVPYD